MKKTNRLHPLNLIRMIALVWCFGLVAYSCQVRCKWVDIDKFVRFSGHCLLWKTKTIFVVDKINVCLSGDRFSSFFFPKYRTSLTDAFVSKITQNEFFSLFFSGQLFEEPLGIEIITIIIDKWQQQNNFFHFFLFSLRSTDTYIVMSPRNTRYSLSDSNKSCRSLLLPLKCGNNNNFKCFFHLLL